jgi:hypothetical protein
LLFFSEHCISFVQASLNSSIQILLACCLVTLISSRGSHLSIPSKLVYIHVVVASEVIIFAKAV